MTITISQDNSAGYLEKVAEPIDLGIIKLKVERKKYKSIADFEADLDLLFSNCFSFYDRSTPQHMVCLLLFYYCDWRAVHIF